MPHVSRYFILVTCTLWLSSCMNLLEGDGFKSGGGSGGSAQIARGPMQDVYYEHPASASGGSFRAANLPFWAVIDPTSGKISGFPSAPGITKDVQVFQTLNGQDNLVETFDIVVAGDPLTNDEWYLGNSGQASFSSRGGTVGEDMKVKDVTRLGITGSKIKIAISDSGMEINHEDLRGNVIPNASRNYAGSPPYAGDPTAPGANGDHGTSVSGIIAAQGWNGIGGRGVAPEAGIAGFNYIPYQKVPGVDVDQITGDFDVFNQSWGAGFACDPANPTPILYADEPAYYMDQVKLLATTYRGGKGATLVRAAGNDFFLCYTLNNQNQLVSWRSRSSNSEEGNANPWVLVVGALNASGRKSSYSSPGSNIWISGTGGEFGDTSPAMVTTDVQGCDKGYAFSALPAQFRANLFEIGQNGNTNCNYTSAFNGTSSAAPSITGVVALMLQANPNLTWRDIRYILAKTATQVDTGFMPLRNPLDPAGYFSEPGWFTNAAGYKFHNWYGFGRANAKAAVDMAKNYSSNWGPQMDLTTNGVPRYSQTVNGNIVDNNINSNASTATQTVTENYVIESVVIEVTATHAYAGDLGVELTSPSNTRSVVLQTNNAFNTANLTAVKLVSNAFYGENSAGQWRIKVLDGAAGNTGTFVSWKLNVYGHAP